MSEARSRGSGHGTAARAVLPRLARTCSVHRGRAVARAGKLQAGPVDHRHAAEDAVEGFRIALGHRQAFAAAFAGSVAPITSRQVAIALSPSSTLTSTGPPATSAGVSVAAGAASGAGETTATLATEAAQKALALGPKDPNLRKMLEQLAGA